MLDQLISQVSEPHILDFFRRNIPTFRPETEEFDYLLKEEEFHRFSELKKLGEADLGNSEDLLVFSCKVLEELSEKSARKKQFDIAKKILKEDFKDGAIFIFYDQQGNFRFSFVQKLYGEKQSKFSNWKRYTYFIEPQLTNRTFRQQIGSCDFSSLQAIQEAFSLEKLNNQFYKDYQRISREINQFIFPKQEKNKLLAHQGTLNLLNRMMFVYFIQKKGWLMQDGQFLHNFWEDYQNSLTEGKAETDTFHRNWLNKVFFSAFNNQAYNDPNIFKFLPEKYHESVLKFPYLNGGLFTQNMATDRFILPDAYFERIFEFMQQYNFTIVEESVEEVAMEVNPELLGKMYEGMINATDLDDVDAENGIVYTERPEINFMARRSMVEVLDKKLNQTSSKYSRTFLYHFCFDAEDTKQEILEKYKPDAEALRQAVMSLTAIDPSCGSGSLLIGVIQLQVELVRSLDQYLKKPLDSKAEFYLKKQIISNSIYGVDVKEWAVRIAELRFWLYMIADAKFSTEELTEKPLLPNLDFKLRQGNSLIQELGGREFSVKALFEGKRKNARAARKLNEFVKKKKAFITNQSEAKTTYKELKQEELAVFKDYLREEIDTLKKRLKKAKIETQVSLFGGEETQALSEPQRKAVEQKLEELRNVLQSIQKDKRLPFSYDIDFMEIFLTPETEEEKGFDLVIGNPPYVRQEDILPADDALEVERLLQPKNRNEKTKVNKAYKEKLAQKIYRTYPFLTQKVKTVVDGNNKTLPLYGSKMPGRSDLYAYFQLLCPALLNSQGTFCFIISNSWLDVDFGGYIQQFLLKHSQLHAIYDSSVRSFSASVNTVIYLHSAVTNQNLTDAQLRKLTPSAT